MQVAAHLPHKAELFFSHEEVRSRGAGAAGGSVREPVAYTLAYTELCLSKHSSHGVLQLYPRRAVCHAPCVISVITGYSTYNGFRGGHAHGRRQRLALQNRAAARNVPLTVNKHNVREYREVMTELRSYVSTAVCVLGPICISVRRTLRTCHRLACTSTRANARHSKH